MTGWALHKPTTPYWTPKTLTGALLFSWALLFLLLFSECGYKSCTFPYSYFCFVSNTFSCSITTFQGWQSKPLSSFLFLKSTKTDLSLLHLEKFSSLFSTYFFDVISLWMLFILSCYIFFLMNDYKILYSSTGLTHQNNSSNYLLHNLISYAFWMFICVLLKLC